jgi:hypothetical protein
MGFRRSSRIAIVKKIIEDKMTENTNTIQLNNGIKSNNGSLDFMLRSFNEKITRGFEKELGENGEDVLVLGYVRVPKIINKDILDRVKAYSEMLFEKQCDLYIIHPNDVVSEIIGKKVHIDTSVRYCIIYR